MVGSKNDCKYQIAIYFNELYMHWIFDLNPQTSEMILGIY